MKNTFLLLAIIPALVLSLFAGRYSITADTGNRRDEVQEEIWELEEAYFTNLYKANYEAVIEIVHDQFLGWPDSVPQPINKEQSTRFMKQLIPKPVPCTLRIERAGIRLLGNTAITQYMLHVNCSDSSGKEKMQSSRITHMWVKEGSHWKLLGGMSRDK
jgi:ketosteroid isomerase-like protein